MQHVQVPLVDIPRQEDVDRLGLADVGCAVSGQLHHPALVEFEGGLVDVLLVLAQDIEVLDRTLVLEDGVPDRRDVLAAGLEQALEVGIADCEGTRQGLVRVDVGRDGLDARAGPAADDRDRCGRGNGQLVREALHDTALGGVRAGPALCGQDA